MTYLAKNLANGGRELIAFRIGNQEFCVNVMSVREIRGWTPATPMPHAPQYVLGVINLRGSVVPVIDLAARFGGRPTEVGKRTCIVIVEVQHEGSTHILGLLVDGVNAVMEIGADSIEPAPAFGTRVNTEFIAGMARVDGRFVIILDIARVLSIEEMAAIRSVGNNPNSGENHVD